MLKSSFGNLISLPIFNRSILSSYQSSVPLLCLTYCDHKAAQTRSHTIADHSMLYTAYSWRCQSCIVQSTVNSNEAIHWCLLTLIILAYYLTATIHELAIHQWIYKK